MADSFYAKKLRTEMMSLDMKQYVDKPINDDLVFANMKLKVCKPKIIDHSWINVEFNICKSREKYREFIGRDYSKFHINDFLKEVEKRIEYGQEVNINATLTEKNHWPLTITKV